MYELEPDELIEIRELMDKRLTVDEMAEDMQANFGGSCYHWRSKIQTVMNDDYEEHMELSADDVLTMVEASDKFGGRL